MGDCGGCPLARACRTRAGLAGGQRLIYYRGRYWSEASWSKARRAGPAECPAVAESPEAGLPGRNRDQGLKTARQAGQDTGQR